MHLSSSGEQNKDETFDSLIHTLNSATGDLEYLNLVANKLATPERSTVKKTLSLVIEKLRKSSKTISEVKRNEIENQGEQK